jgi:hypothetical protein
VWKSCKIRWLVTRTVPFGTFGYTLPWSAENSWTWLNLALPAADLAGLPKKGRYLSPLFQISGEVFKPAQGHSIALVPRVDERDSPFKSSLRARRQDVWCRGPRPRLKVSQWNCPLRVELGFPGRTGVNRR